jgi:hypothetical protein
MKMLSTTVSALSGNLVAKLLTFRASGHVALLVDHNLEQVSERKVDVPKRRGLVPASQPASLAECAIVHLGPAYLLRHVSP